MNNYTFLFPGQGSQFAGMGKSLFHDFVSARRIFQEADDTLKFPLSRLCFEGPESDLRTTENTQPALVTVSTAAVTVLREEGIEAVAVAGHSLGEYSALVAAGSLRFADALLLVRNRGRYMQEAVPEGTGAMAAILKLPADKLDQVLRDAAQGQVVTAANLNSPDQVVISGHAEAVARAMNLAKAAGAKRVILLPVSAPFHCPLMLPARERLGRDLEQARFSDLKMPMINNWLAREIYTAEEARRGLYEQIPKPVRWREIMEAFSRAGLTNFLEVGPGTVLAGLVRGNLPNATCTSFEQVLAAKLTAV